MLFRVWRRVKFKRDFNIAWITSVILLFSCYKHSFFFTQKFIHYVIVKTANQKFTNDHENRDWIWRKRDQLAIFGHCIQFVSYWIINKIETSSQDACNQETPFWHSYIVKVCIWWYVRRIKWEGSSAISMRTKFQS